MSAILSPIINPVGTSIITDSSVNATVQANVTGTNSTIYAVEVDNTNNSTAVYFKIFDLALPTIGSSIPVYKLKIPGLTKLPFDFIDGMEMSIAISYACTTESTATGVTAPTRAVTMTMLVG